jgi:hypothetical protein
MTENPRIGDLIMLTMNTSVYKRGDIFTVTKGEIDKDMQYSCLTANGKVYYLRRNQFRIMKALTLKNKPQKRFIEVW